MTDKRYKIFIQSLQQELPPYLEALRREAEACRVPIIRREMQDLLAVQLALVRPDRILEIGTATGFSALFMAENAPDHAQITTIENYEKRIPVAIEHFDQAGRADQIELLRGDAQDVLKTLEDPYDFVFMDAAKGQYLNFLPDVLRLLRPGGVLITDNIFQDGDILESRFLVTRRDRTIHKRMREFLYQLTHSEELKTVLLPIGDGAALSVRNESKGTYHSDSHRKRMTMRNVELLLPAGSLEVLKVAVRYGADAVYIGGEAFGLRAKAKNFSLEQMREGIDFAHAHGVKVYVTANIFAHNTDLSGIRTYFEELRDIRPDALLISDPGVFLLARKVCPEIEIHISTQSNNTNYETYRFWFDLGATRVVAGRELSLQEISEIRAHIPEDKEIEAFVHGAMCMSYSGRCLLSNYLTGRDANRGACTHPCRWKYALVEETRPGEYFPVFENDRGTYIFNSRDLCMIEHLPEMLDAGIDSLKVEGRMKTALYVATVARAYRHAIDDYRTDPELFKERLPWYHERIAECTYRQYTTGFFFGKPTDEAQIYDNNTYIRAYTYLGLIRDFDENGLAVVEQKNKFYAGDEIEIMKPDGRNIRTRVLEIRDASGEMMESCPHAGQELHLLLSEKPEAYDILRAAGNVENA